MVCRANRRLVDWGIYQRRLYRHESRSRNYHHSNLPAEISGSIVLRLVRNSLVLHHGGNNEEARLVAATSDLCQFNLPQSAIRHAVGGLLGSQGGIIY